MSTLLHILSLKGRPTRAARPGRAEGPCVAKCLPNIPERPAKGIVEPRQIGMMAALSGNVAPANP
jgi:hypothetical protein